MSFVSHTEYSYTTNITEKSDVYSYGVVLLEILSGRAAIERAQPSAGTDVGVHIVEWAKKKMGSLEPAVTLLDPRLHGMPDQIIQEMLQTLGIAMFCVNPSPGERPTMKEVVALLKEVKSPTPEEWGKVSQPLIKGSNNG
jgi:serine/threonine protein kinase